MAAAPQAAAGSRSSSAGQDEIPPRLVCLGLALLTLLVYLPVWQQRFLWFDDPLFITENKAVQAGLTWKSIQWAFTDLHASMWHPVTWLSHMLDCQLFGLDPGAHHLVNALWHAICAGLVLRVFYVLTGALWPSAFAAAAFTLHPLRVESVAWAAERKDLLSAFFFLLMVLAYLKYVRTGDPNTEVRSAGAKSPTIPRRAGGQKPRQQRESGVPIDAEPGLVTRGSSTERVRKQYVYYGLAMFCFALGLMSKAMLVTAPFVLLLLDVWPLRRVQRLSGRQVPAGLGSVLVEKMPFFALAAAVSLVTMLAQRSDSMASLAAYPLRLRAFYAVVAYGSYLLKTLWPVDLAIVYPLPHELPWLEFAVSALAVLAISWGCWRLRRSRPHFLVGWLWFVGTLVPVIGLVQVGGQWMADRYTYLPHIGLFLALAFEARSWLRQWQASLTGKATWGLGTGNPARAEKLRSVSTPQTGQLPERDRRLAGVLAGVVLVACIGLSERQLGYWADGCALFTHAIAVTGDNAFADLNLGVSLEHTGQRDAARREYERAVKLDPGLPEAHANLGDLLNESGETEAAIVQYQACLRLQNLPRVHENLGALLVKGGQFEPAMGHYAAAAKLEPDDPRAYYLMGKALLRQGHSRQAVEQFQEALRRDPNDLQTLVFLARVLAADPQAAVRNGAQAVSLAERANTLSGGAQSFVLDTLAMAYAESGRFGEALSTQQQAIDRANEAGETDALDALRERLELYRKGAAYRERSGEG